MMVMIDCGGGGRAERLQIPDDECNFFFCRGLPANSANHT
jgi:hypothetical protein